MKRTILVLACFAVGIFLLALPSVGWGAVDVGNKTCPVSGEEVGKMGPVVKYEHDGKVFNFCCAMCLKDFKKDPDKYIQKLKDNGDYHPSGEEVTEGAAAQEQGH